MTVFCAAPFASLFVDPNGSRTVCCIFPRGDERAADERSIAAVRAKMVAGAPVSGCAQCIYREKTSGSSLRTFLNEILDHHIDPSRVADPDYENVLYYDIAFSNKCNQKCRMCSPTFSTAWVKDARRLGMPVETPVTTARESVEAILSRIDRSTGPLHLELKGGEPFMIEDASTFLEALLARGAQTRVASLTTFTNGSVVNSDFVALLARFPNVMIKYSIDAVGPLYGYVRGYKGSFEDVEANIRSIMDGTPTAIHRLSSLVMIYNVFSLGDLEAWSNRIGADMIVLKAIHQPDHLSVANLPDDLKDLARDRSRSLSPRYRSVVENALSDAPGGTTDAFVRYTRALDTIRGESILSIVPEIASLFEP